MSHIVLAVDEDEERARLSAEAVASLEWDADALEVTVLHVFSDNPEGAAVSQVGSAKAARDVLEDAGIDVDLSERSGDAAGQIVRFAEGEGVDAIAIAGRGRTPAGKAVFGSVSQSVMLDSDIPVLFVPTGDD